jgi:hypothetical protein
MFFAGFVADPRIVNPLLADVETAAPLAAVDREAIAFTVLAGRLVPKVEGDTVFVGSPALSVKCPAARDIRARENQLMSLHRDRHPISKKADRQAKDDRRHSASICVRSVPV